MEKSAWIHHLMVSQHMTAVQAEQYYEANLKPGCSAPTIREPKTYTIKEEEPKT